MYSTTNGPDNCAWRSFCLCSTSPKKSCEDIRSIATADKLVRHYPGVFAKDLGTLPGTVHLKVDENAEPSVTPSQQILTALREKFKAQLDHLENLGELTKVNEPTAWVSTVVIVTEKSGALRICIDPRLLNQALKRETHQLPILDNLIPELARAKNFSTVDLTAGYWHCVLDDKSSLLTTFATPFGRYQWKRLPFGLSASSEIFQKWVSQALDGLEGILNITGEILLYGVGDTKDEARCDHNLKLEALLPRCRECGIALKKNKLTLRITEVPFMGHLFPKHGLKIDPDKAKAVLEMPRPEDVEGVQRLNGLVNYLSKFLPRLADHMEPIRHLTRQDTEFNWMEEQQRDTSKKGLGAVLLQRGKLIVYTSRALTEIEQWYTQNEKEMLAIIFSLGKFNQYTYRRHVKIQSDHKLLQSWRSLSRVHKNAFKAWWWDFRNQALGFQIPWITNFWFHTQRSWETIGNNFLVPRKFMGTHFHFF